MARLSPSRHVSILKFPEEFCVCVCVKEETMSCVAGMKFSELLNVCSKTGLHSVVIHLSVIHRATGRWLHAPLYLTGRFVAMYE